jgi:TolB-like protein/Tfp pilus assembly protein PilF
MASGTLPFAHENPLALVAAIVQESPRPLPARVPASLRTIVTRCLANQPEHRYQRASEVRAALELIDTSAVDAHQPAQSTASASRRPLRYSITGVALAVIVLGGWWARTRNPTGSAPLPRIASLAVLPFGDFSSDPEQQYFADGMTEALIATVAQIRGLRVPSRTSVMRYKRTTRSVPEIARELGVDAVLEGSVVRSADRVRITAQLIRAASDEHMWADTYERELRDILALQSAVARAVARQVQANLTPEEEAKLRRTPLVDPAAHEAYLRGRFFWNRRTTTSLDKAVEYFEQSAGADPNYAPAYAGIAGAYLMLTNWDIASRQPRELMPKSEAAIVRALQIDDSLADAHAVLAYIRLLYDWNLRAAEQEFRRALDLENPNLPIPRFWYATCLAVRGRMDDAIDAARRGAALDPFSAIFNAGVAWMYHFARRHEEAVVHAKKALELDPQFPVGLVRLGVAYRHLGRPDAAIQTLALARDASGGTSSVRAQLALAYLEGQRGADAQRELRQLVTMSHEGASAAYAIAIVYAGLGNKDEAFRWLERAVEERSAMIAFLTIEPDIDALRSDPRLAAIIARVAIAR